MGSWGAAGACDSRRLLPLQLWLLPQRFGIVALLGPAPGDPVPSALRCLAYASPAAAVATAAARERNAHAHESQPHPTSGVQRRGRGGKGMVGGRREEAGRRRVVGDGWGGEDKVVGWLPPSLWSLTRLQQLATNVAGECHCMGLNILFRPPRFYTTHPHQCHCQCLAALPNLTSLSLLAHRSFPPCLSFLSSLTLLSIPLASPLHRPASLALFSPVLVLP
ncbi:unnamed protein product [Closterium sp. NIES-65]|nr:unnamed protein product [Closterium sp. NIES-65]